MTSGYFSLIIDDQQTGASDGIPKTSQAVTSTNVTITGLGTQGRTETIDDGNEGASDKQFYMALSFAVDGINEVTYSGIITFTVTN